jgi:hypothetical protein
MLCYLPPINAVMIVMMVVMIMMKSANISNNVINRSSRLVDTLRMCKYLNNTYCRSYLTQKLLRPKKYFLTILFHTTRKVTCCMFHLRW